MQSVQKLLLVVGATALGSTLCILALLGYTEATGFLSHHGPSDLGAAGLAVLLFAGSATLGALAGLVASLWWIRKHDSRLWPVRIWGGVTLGLLTGIAFHIAATTFPRVPLWIENFDHPLAAALQTVALCMLGGLIANFAGPRGSRSAGSAR